MLLNGPQLTLDLAVVFLLGVRVALQQLHQAADVENFLFLGLQLALLLLQPVRKALHRQTRLTDPLQLDFQESHVRITICH